MDLLKYRPTNAEMAESCSRNASEASDVENRVREAMKGMAPEDPGLLRLRVTLNNAIADKKHWFADAERFRKLAHAEAGDPRLPRERDAGDDDS